VVIVGAGPAGCAAALSLPPGTRGLLIDRSSPDGDRCCGGLLAPDAQQALAALGLTLPPAVRVYPEPQMVRVHDLDSGRSQSYRRDYLNVDRRRFDSWLLQSAAERVEVRHRARFAGLDGPDVLLRAGGITEAVPARLVIGTDGAGSAVRERCFPGRSAAPLMLALQATFSYGDAVPEALQEHVVLFASDLTGFYAWAIPKGDGVLVGCAFHEKRGARERFERVLDWYRGELGLEGRPATVSGRYLSQPQRWAHLFPGDGHALLAGEAAGLVSPSSGEGISFALESGAAAGRATGHRPDGAAAPAAAYRRAFMPLARKVMVKTVKARIIYSPAAREWALRLPWCP
jgi:geranylgeranyl diphosphate/geranylgeranyl-bacteriochlorophyllide a reductase